MIIHLKNIIYIQQHIYSGLNPIFKYSRDIVLIICTLIITYKTISSKKKKKKRITSKFSLNFQVNLIFIWLICIGVINPFNIVAVSIIMMLVGWVGYSYFFVTVKLYKQKFELIFYITFFVISTFYILILLLEKYLIIQIIKYF